MKNKMMSDGALSQDEINALLSGGSINDESNGGANPFTNDQLAKLKDYFTAIAAASGAILGGMAGLEATVSLADVMISNKEELITKLTDEVLDVTVNFSGDVSGGHYFILNSDDAIKFGSAMVGQALSEIDGATISAFSELFSQLSGMAVTQLSGKTGKNFNPASPNGQVVAKGLSRIPAAYFIALVYNVTYEENSFVIYEILDEFVTAALTQAASDLPPQQPMPSYMTKEPMIERNSEEQRSPIYKSQTPNVQGVQLPNLTPGNAPAETRNISLLMDVMMELTVELGRTRWQIKDILGMGEGTIIELDKLAGEPVDILVNHNLIARGEVVVIDENFGVRVTEIISGMDKLAERR